MNREYPPGPRIYPGMDASYNLTSSVKFFGSYNSSLRLPTFTDLFYSGPSNMGNPELKPEKVNHYEGGIKLNVKNVTGHAAYFYYDGKDIIAWAKENNNENVWKTRNLTFVQNQGIELSLLFHFSEIMKEGLPLQNLRLNYTYLDQDKDTKGADSKYTLNYLTHDFGMNVSGSWRNWSWCLLSSYTDRTGKYFKFDFDKKEYTSEVEYIPAWVFDYNLSYVLNDWKFYVNVNNVLDNRHSDIGNIRVPGRWISIGVIKQFNIKP
jgi:iron complex outermembrane receptor protein